MGMKMPWKKAKSKEPDKALDTPKVDRVAINFHFVKDVTEYTKDPTTKKLTKGTSKLVTGNFLAFVPESFQSYFDIPKFTGTLDSIMPKAELIEIPEVSYEMKLDATGTKKVTVVRKKHQRVKNSITKQRRSKPVLLPLPDQVTSKGNPRMAQFGFPQFFTVPMIMQAVATMLESAKADRKPLFFKMADSGSTYTIPYGIGLAVPAGWEQGAWHATTWGPESNIGNLDEITPSTAVAAYSGG